jgi:hypothetical protein
LEGWQAREASSKVQEESQEGKSLLFVKVRRRRRRAGKKKQKNFLSIGASSYAADRSAEARLQMDTPFA